jgi:hypothetical protein
VVFSMLVVQVSHYTSTGFHSSTRKRLIIFTLVPVINPASTLRVIIVQDKHPPSLPPRRLP